MQLQLNAEPPLSLPMSNVKRGPARPGSTTTILITGFGPFPGVPHNISEMLATEVARLVRKKIATADVVATTLPTEWDVAPDLICDLICDVRPALAVHFGVSDRAEGFVVETIARNRTGRVDAAGVEPLAAILDPFGPEQYATQLPAGRMAARLRRIGLPAQISRDAGSYLCNAVFYRSVQSQRLSGAGGRSGFVHVPVSVTDNSAGRGLIRRRRPVLDLDATIRGGIEVVEACLNR